MFIFPLLEVFVAQLHITEKVLAKCGLNWTKSSISTKRSRYFFRELNYEKTVNGKIAAAKKVEFFNSEFNPAFCQYNVMCSCFFVVFFMRFPWDFSIVFCYKIQVFLFVYVIFRVVLGRIFNFREVFVEFYVSFNFYSQSF